MQRMLLRMQRSVAGLMRPIPPGFDVEPYDSGAHHDAIPDIFEAAFGRERWPDDWEQFSEFDSHGVFVARDLNTRLPVGFVISFRRGDFGYISVVAVVPEYQRRGLASALVSQAISFLELQNLSLARIDAWEDAESAVQTYEKLGFEVYDRRLEDDD